MSNHTTSQKLNWIPLPDPITEEEVNIELTWTADQRTRQAIERQAACMGFKSPDAYLQQLIAAALAGNEEDTIFATSTCARRSTITGRVLMSPRLAISCGD